jgi:diketogulonate reductase-like aldo/keto reductase
MLTRPFFGSQRAVALKLEMNNGLSIPALGFGTYRAEPDQVAAAVGFAIDKGFRHIDCAKIYGNQREVGAAVRAAMARNKLRREDLFVTSKLWPTDQHPAHVEAACRDSNAELGLGYLDMYLMHWPQAWKHTGSYATEADRWPLDGDGRVIVDASVSLADTYRAMEKLVALGLTRSIGLSNAEVRHMEELLEAGMEIAPATNQIELHPALQNSAVKNFGACHGVLTTSYCPLGMPTRFTPGGFTGVAKHSYFTPLIGRTGFTVPRMLLNWNVDQGNVVLTKSLNKQHIEQNAKVSTNALGDPMRWVIENFRGNFNVRVIDPPALRRDDGASFFDDVLQVPSDIQE